MKTIAMWEWDAEKTAPVLQAPGQILNRQKEIIYLKFYQELNYEEVSGIMNINYQAARNLLYQFIKSLKKLLTALTFPCFLFFDHFFFVSLSFNTPQTLLRS